MHLKLFTLSGIEKDFKIFSDINRYRYEFNEAKEVFILMPQQKMAIWRKQPALIHHVVFG